MRLAAKLISTILLLVLTTVPVSYLFIFHAHQRRIRHEMKDRLEHEMLHTVTIPKSELRWVKPGKEIALGENLFDIKTLTELHNGMVRLTGIYDFEETFVVKQMKKTQDDDAAKGNKLMQIMQLLQSSPGTIYDEVYCYGQSLSEWFIINDARLSSPFRSILTPPPQN